jgi:hypothetical protein
MLDSFFCSPYYLASALKKCETGACSKTWLVLNQAPGKTGKSPVFPLNSGKLFQKLKFWNSLVAKNGGKDEKEEYLDGGIVPGGPDRAVGGGFQGEYHQNRLQYPPDRGFPQDWEIGRAHV